MTRPCVIFDIDGTVADCSHRLHFIKRDGVFGTSRPKRILHPTVSWLHVHAPWLSSYQTYMRADDDRRSSAEVKADYLDKMARDGFRPIYAFEDRAQDAAMWRAAGITCLQVAEGNY